MSMSNKFKNATDHLKDIVMTMIYDTNIADYLVYEGESTNILNEYVFMSFPDVENLPDDFKTKVYVNPDSGRDYMGNQATMQEIYKVDIIVPQKEAMTTSGNLRAFGVAYEMSKNIDNKHMSGIGNAEIFDYKYYKLGDNHVALTFFIQIMSQKKRVM